MLLMVSCALMIQGSAHAQTSSANQDAVKNESASGACKVSCVTPDAADDEAQKVIKVVEQITQALAERKFDVMIQHMDAGCTTYDEVTRKTVVGPENIVADVKQKIAVEETKSHAPIVSYKIDSPFARVKGDTAVVCFVLVKELGGDHPQTFEEHCTDVFVKRGGDWKKLNFRGSGWKHK
ncbi:MAG TPA: nuclear transport factor 2 family protein [Chroococcales cyanobacterium]